MSIASEGEAILNRAKAQVNQALAGEIADMAKNEISYMVQAAVYPAYSPTQYKRRGMSGGIADKSLYHVTNGDMSLTVADDRPEVGVVESGAGYTWEHSRIYLMQPYPRPYFQQAEENTAANAEPMIQAILSSM